MQKISQLPRSIFIILFLLISVIFFTKCVDNSQEKTAFKNETSFNTYAGDASCANCHKDIYNQHLLTGHFNTSAPATEQNVMGSFKNDSNIYRYTPLLYVAMEKSDSSLYQKVFYKEELKKKFRFDFVTGSGAKGQTYIYKKGNQLFQMPVSFFTGSLQWVNSPGFKADRITFDKPVTTRCLECHATYASVISEPTEKQESYDYSKMIWGVGCEKCHGPAEKHVEYQTKNPLVKTAQYIVNPVKLNRQQQLDLCVLCHGGNLEKTQPSFSFTAGKKLSDYFKTEALYKATAANENIDVHGNQFGLLKKSKCYLNSNAMTCNTCHGAHEKERGNVALFSQRCISCHNRDHKTFCTFKQNKNVVLEKNCIDCHLPAKPSISLTMNLQDAAVPTVALLRTHLISVDTEAIKKYLATIKK